MVKQERTVASAWNYRQAIAGDLFIYLLYESYTKYKKTGKERETERQTDRQTTECNQHVDK